MCNMNNNEKPLEQEAIKKLWSILKPSKKKSCSHHMRVQIGPIDNAQYHICRLCDDKIAEKDPKEEFVRCDECDINLCGNCF